MIIGFTGLTVGFHFLASPAYKLFTMLAVVSATVYTGLISLNYMLQLAVLQPAIENKQLDGMAMLVFGNPHSVTMAIEMLGYGFQGVATWLIGYAADRSKLGKWIQQLGMVNGLVSIAGVILQGLHIPMAITHSFGFLAFVGWNILFSILRLFYVVYFKRKLNASSKKPELHSGIVY